MGLSLSRGEFLVSVSPYLDVLASEDAYPTGSYDLPWSKRLTDWHRVAWSAAPQDPASLATEKVVNQGAYTCIPTSGTCTVVSGYE